jgi:hypothetical protein
MDNIYFNRCLFSWKTVGEVQYIVWTVAEPTDVKRYWNHKIVKAEL